jgi:hypothetical protein
MAWLMPQELSDPFVSELFDIFARARHLTLHTRQATISAVCRQVTVSKIGLPQDCNICYTSGEKGVRPMSKALSPICLCIVVLAGIAASALPVGAESAGVPHHGMSDAIATPDHGAYCPGSDKDGDEDVLTVTVNVRDCYGIPLPGRLVVVNPIIVDVDSGPGYKPGHCFCSGEAPESCMTDVNGTCSVTFSNFGGCDTKTGDGGDCGLQFSTVCQGVELGPTNRVTTASPDTDADCDVDLMDFIFFASVYLGDEWCVDFDYDGDVDLMDFIKFAGYYLRSCEQEPSG